MRTDLAGGTLDGQTGTVVIEAEKGSVIDIPAAPTRDGYVFQYWEGSRHYPGDKYTVTGDHTFTAVWEERASSDGSNQPTSDSTDLEDASASRNPTNPANSTTNDANNTGGGASTATRTDSSTKTATPHTGDAGMMLVPVLASAALVSIAVGTLCALKRLTRE